MLKHIVVLSLCCMACGRGVDDIEHPKPYVEPVQSVQGTLSPVECDIKVTHDGQVYTWTDVSKSYISSIPAYYDITTMEVTCHD